MCLEWWSTGEKSQLSRWWKKLGKCLLMTCFRWRKWSDWSHLHCLDGLLGWQSRQHFGVSGISPGKHRNSLDTGRQGYMIRSFWFLTWTENYHLVTVFRWLPLWRIPADTGPCLKATTCTLGFHLIGLNQGKHHKKTDPVIVYKSSGWHVLFFLGFNVNHAIHQTFALVETNVYQMHFCYTWLSCNYIS